MENKTLCGTKMIADEMILTKEIPTTAGSKMLDGYVSLLESEALARASAAGAELAGKADVGEFAIDLVGETSAYGAWKSEGAFVSASAALIGAGEADFGLCLDVNGAPRRAAAQSGVVFVKPTYGTVSRFGTIPVACSGECVGVMAADADMCKRALDAIAGHDDKDGTSLSDELCAKAREGAAVKKVAVISSLMSGVDADIKAKIDGFAAFLSANSVEVETIDAELLAASKTAWNILMSAELCNNVSRYDGVKFGYRAENFSGIDELYTNSRTEAFGELLKTAILFGSETLSTENYMKVYDKAQRVRRLVCEEFAKIFESYDAVLIPACSVNAYTEEQVKADKYIAFEENFYTAPASLAGLPAVACGGVQLVGKAFSETALLEVAKLYGEGR